MDAVLDIPSMHRKPPTSSNARHTWLWSPRLRVVTTVLAVIVSLSCIFYARAAADTLPSAYGIDISHYNMITRPAAIRANGVTFAYVKVTEGITYTDPSLSLHLAELRSVGIRVGGYHFARGCAGDARAFHRQLLAHGLLGAGDLVPMLDMEAPALAHIADACIRAFYDALGAPALLVYGDRTWWTTYLHPATWGHRAILGWIARYNGNPGHPGTTGGILTVHQHTDRGRVPGIAGYVDRDALIPGHTLAELVLGGPPLPVVVPPTRTAPRIYIVRSGDTLSGIATRLHYPGGWPALARRDHLRNPDRIYPGERLAV